jgi:hypothetical protein
MKRPNELVAIAALVWLASCSGSHAGGGTAGTVGTGQAGAGGTAGGTAGSTAGTGGTGGGTAGTAGSIAGTGGGPAGAGGGTAGTGGGTAGIGGGSVCTAGGFLAVSGSSGCQPPRAPVCGSALCGNDVIDACAVASTVTCPARTDTEECDGADHGGVTCESLGFGSGQLSCASCAIDRRGCNDCLPIANGVLSCGKPPVDASNPASSAIAAGASEVGLAWIQSDNGGVPLLSFARLTANLELISSSVIAQGPAIGCPGRWSRVAVAALATGWIVAVGGEPEVFFYALDGAGQVIARTVVERQLQLYTFQGGGSTPLLVPRPDGAPLMLWQVSDRSPRAALIAADGRSTAAPVDLPVTGAAATFALGAAYLQGAFHVVEPRGGTNPYLGLTLVRIGSDGAIASTTDILSDESLAIQGVAAGTDDLRLLYSTVHLGAADENALMFRRISSAGNLLTPAAPLGLLRDQGFLVDALAWGDDTVVLSLPKEPKLGWVRLTPEGTVRSQGVFATNPYGFVLPRLTQSGSAIIASWQSVSLGTHIVRFSP